MPDLAATTPTGDDRRSVSRTTRLPPRPARLDDLPPRALVTVGSVLVVGLLALAAVVPQPRTVTAAVVLLAGILVANGWTRVLDLPSRKGTALVALLGAVSTTLAVAASGRGGGPDPSPHMRYDFPVGWLPVALAVSVVGAFAHQLLRTDGRPRVVASLSGSLLTLSLLAAGACWVAVPSVPHGREVTLAVAAGLALSAVVEWAAQRVGHTSVLLPVSMAVGGLVSALAGAALGVTWGVTLLLGLLACAVAFSVRALLAPLPQLVARRAQLVSAAASVLAAGAVVLVGAELLLR